MASYYLGVDEIMSGKQVIVFQTTRDGRKIQSTTNLSGFPLIVHEILTGATGNPDNIEFTRACLEIIRTTGKITISRNYPSLRIPKDELERHVSEKLSFERILDSELENARQLIANHFGYPYPGWSDDAVRHLLSLLWNYLH